jgi:Homing endonuclease associated repeat
MRRLRSADERQRRPRASAEALPRLRGRAAAELERAAGAGGDPRLGRLDRLAPHPGRLVARSLPEHEGAARYRSAPGGWPSASTVAARFGSLGAAIEAAGLGRARGQPDGRPPRWSFNAIAEAMRDHASRTGQPPRRSDWQHASEDHPAASTVYRVAGSWRQALEAAGL